MKKIAYVLGAVAFVALTAAVSSRNLLQPWAGHLLASPPMELAAPQHDIPDDTASRAGSCKVLQKVTDDVFDPVIAVRVNGEPIDMVVGSMTDEVILTADDAFRARIGIGSDGRPPVANPRYDVIQSVEIAGTVQTSVRAFILENHQHWRSRVPMRLLQQMFGWYCVG